MYGAHGTQKPSDISKNSSQTELDLANVGTREWDLLSVSNGLEAFDLYTAVQQQRNEVEHHPVEISYLTDSFEVVQPYSMEASFVTMSLNVFIYEEIRSKFSVL